MVNWRIYQEKTFIERQYNTCPQTAQDHILPIVSLNISYVCSNRYAWKIPTRGNSVKKITAWTDNVRGTSFHVEIT